MTTLPSRHPYRGGRRASVRSGRRLGSFPGSRLHQSAVIRALEVIGEAAGRLSPEFTSGHPELPWRDIINMGHRLIHAYNAVRLDIVWDVTQNQITEILAVLTPLVPKADLGP